MCCVGRAPHTLLSGFASQLTAPELILALMHIRARSIG